MEGGKGKGSKDNGNGWKKEKLLRILQKLVFSSKLRERYTKDKNFHGPTDQFRNSEQKIVVKIGAKTKNMD